MGILSKMASFHFWVTDWGKVQLHKLSRQLALERLVQCGGEVRVGS